VVLKVVAKAAEAANPPVALGLFIWGCGGRMIIDPDGALPLPVCPPLR
jgi:hypothetical protein